MGLSVVGQNSGGPRVNRPPSESSDNTKNDDTNLASYLMFDDFEDRGYGMLEVNVNVGSVAINDLEPGDITKRRLDKNMPRPLDLEKRHATQKSILIRFKAPQEKL